MQHPEVQALPQSANIATSAASCYSKRTSLTAEPCLAVQLDGMGSTADVVYDDIVTCSNTIIYPISNFLLPVAST